MISLLVDLFTWQSGDEALLIYLLLVHYYVFVSGFLFLLYVFSLNVFLVIDFVLLPTCILGFEAPDFAYGGEDVSRRIMGSLPELAIGRRHYPERHSSPVVSGCQERVPGHHTYHLSSGHSGEWSYQLCLRFASVTRVLKAVA